MLWAVLSLKKPLTYNALFLKAQQREEKKIEKEEKTKRKST